MNELSKFLLALLSTGAGCAAMMAIFRIAGGLYEKAEARLAERRLSRPIRQTAQLNLNDQIKEGWRLLKDGLDGDDKEGNEIKMLSAELIGTRISSNPDASRAEKALAFNLLGSVAAKNADFELAASYAQRSLELAPKPNQFRVVLGDVQSKTLVLSSNLLLAEVAFVQENIDAAIDYLERAREVAETRGLTLSVSYRAHVIGPMYLNLASLYQDDTARLAQASVCCQKAIENLDPDSSERVAADEILLKVQRKLLDNSIVS